MVDPEFGVEMLSRKCAMSRPVLYKKIKALTNLSVNDFKITPADKAALLLQQKQLTVNEICFPLATMTGDISVKNLKSTLVKYRVNTRQ